MCPGKIYDILKRENSTFGRFPECLFWKRGDFLETYEKRKITVLAGVILCVIAGCLVKRMTAMYTQKENPIGPERGTTDVFLTAADFISEKSDQELLQETKPLIRTKPR